MLNEAMNPGGGVEEEVRRLWLAGRVEEARLALVRATEQSVYRFLKSMLRNEEATEDLFQDTYLKAFQALGSFRGEARLTTWMLSIARNVALNRLRRGKLEARWNVVSDEPPEVADPRAGAQPAEPGLLKALEALPARQREVVLLYYVEDMAIEDVVRLTGRPANTIKSDLHRAREALRQALGNRQVLGDRKAGPSLEAVR